MKEQPMNLPSEPIIKRFLSTQRTGFAIAESIQSAQVQTIVLNYRAGVCV